MNDHLRIERRDLMKACAVTAVAATCDSALFGRPRSSAGGRSLPVGDADFDFATLARLEGDLSGTPLYSFSGGQVHALVPSDTLPLNEYGRLLYAFQGCSVKRSRRRKDGAIETVSRGQLFYVDPQTGAYLREFVNPYTGEKIEVKTFRGGISGGVLTRNGPEIAASFKMDSTVFGKPARLDYTTIGERTWIRRHAYTRWHPAGEAAPKTEFTLDTWCARTADLLNPRLTHIPSTSSWTSQTEWQSWLKMPPGYPGFLIWTSAGTEFRSENDLPAAFLAEMRQRDPAFLSAPLAFKD